MSLAKKWTAPNPNRQVGQISFRPALHILAKLNALTAVFDRNKTEIINDLLDKAFPLLEEEIKDIAGHRMEPVCDDLHGHYDEKVYNDLEFFKAYQKAYEEQLSILRGESADNE